jgi:nitroimidazol reductase NimA-like FMN-containing flavoprotein (pyridoxamine 5'-phosphate oxidase superfamily)
MEPEGLIDGEDACSTNTRFRSVVVLGRAVIIEDEARRQAVLEAFVLKYAPRHKGRAFPEGMLAATGVIGVEIGAVTGKFFR